MTDPSDDERAFAMKEAGQTWDEWLFDRAMLWLVGSVVVIGLIALLTWHVKRSTEDSDRHRRPSTQSIER